MVLGKQFFKKIQSVDQQLFGDFDGEFVEALSYKKLYELKPSTAWKEVDFISIYDKNYEA